MLHFGNVILSLISNANTPERLAKSPNSGTGNAITPVYPFSQVPSGCAPPKSKQEIDRGQRVNTSKDMTRLLQLVTEQGRKYEERSSTHSNFYCRHVMV